MHISRITIFLAITLFLTSCAFTPEQRAAREAKRLRAEQALQVKLAKQCDMATAELMEQQFNPPLSPRSAQAQLDFEKQYAEKVNNPVFQACYKLAWQNYQAREELDRMYRYYDDDFRFFRFSRFCYSYC